MSPDRLQWNHHGSSSFRPESLEVKLNTLIQDRQLRRIGDLSPRTVDARFIAATNRDLTAMVADRSFRLDLYYRLNVFPIELPPLRERREDIALLAENHLVVSAAREGKQIASMASDVEAALAGYDWPGNVRELENVIERAVILATGDVLTAECFPKHLLQGTPRRDVVPRSLSSLSCPLRHRTGAGDRKDAGRPVIRGHIVLRASSSSQCRS